MSSYNLDDCDLSFVSGGIPNPDCFKMDENDIPADKKNNEHFMHWWRIFHNCPTDEDKEIEKRKRDKGIIG